MISASKNIKRIKIFSYLFLGLTILCLYSSCQFKTSKKKIIIGFSQCCKDPWRTVMENEMHREMDFHPEAELIIKGAISNSQKQIEQIEELIETGIDLLIVAPNESEPLTKIIDEVYQSGIPVILVDRETKSNHYTTYVGASNYEMGKTAGHYIASQINKSGKIIELALSQSITPAVGRSNGFRDALRQYSNMEIIASYDSEKGIEYVDKWLPEVLEKYPKANAIYAHTDLLAERAYQIIRAKGKANQFFFLGIDGLAGKDGGIQMVEDGIINSTLLYPTGGTESIKAAMQILNNLPVEKRIELNTTVIDIDNARIINHQMEKVLSLQENIGQQKTLINELENIYKNQQTLIIVLISSLLLTLILGGSFWRSLQLKKEANESLQLKNADVLKQQEQLMQLSQKVKAATQAKVDFFTNISHELKTPLTLITGFADDLLPSSKLSKDLQQGMFLIKENANRLLRLVNQLMDFRKMETTGMKVNASENDLIDFINNILNSYRRVAQKHNIDLKLVTRYDKLPLWFDVNMLDKVLFNLLSNAFKFTPDGEEINIFVSKDTLQNRVKIKVEDKGKGMSSETVQHIFEPFYQGEGSKQSGTGLGLPLSKKLVQLHGGEIRVHSIPQKGSRFTIELLLGNAHFKKEQLSHQAPIDFIEREPAFQSDLLLQNKESFNSALKKHTILIIEDNRDIQFFLQKKLQTTYEIFEALDGETGINLAFEQVPDLIICDVKLPGENGLKITKNLKEDLRTSHIPILILTSQSTIEQQIAGTKAGADAYLTKPFNVQFLKEKIKNLLHNRQLLKESFGNDLLIIDNSLKTNSIDKKFLNQLIAYIETNYNRQDFQVADLCEELHLSRSQLYRKVKALLGQSISDYIQNVRLQKAEALLKKRELSISEIAYQVGYTSPEYFSTVFKGRYGVSPSQFGKE